MRQVGRGGRCAGGIELPLTEARVLDALRGGDLFSEDRSHVLPVDAVGVRVGGDRVEHLSGTLGIGDGAAVDPLERRDGIGGREPLGSDIDEVVQWAEGFGLRRGR